MIKGLKYLALTAALITLPANAQTMAEGSAADVTSIASETAISARPAQEHCITVLAGFPNEDHIPRYQFFKLTKEIARDATPDFRAALSAYGSGMVSAETPVLEVIETIANPVLRQAAPELSVSHMAYLIDFADNCSPYLDGQIASLTAYDTSLNHAEFNTVISEDALYLRQILSDVLFRLGADQDPVHGAAINRYAGALVTTRDHIEFAGFEAELEDIEASYMVDLDGRLKRSNDVINEEMDRDTLANSIAITDEMNGEARRKRKRNALQTLSDILNRY